MSQALPIPPPGFDELSVEEKVDYVQSLWDRIAVRPEDVPVPDWHLQVIEERLAAHEADPAAARPWDEVREEVADTLKRRRRAFGGAPAA
jgi:putative addiction module component (TIGR02574 family)